MPNLSIKNVPEAVVAALRERANSNHRSLQGELMALICRAVEGPDTPVTEHRPATTGQRIPEPASTGTPIEEIIAEHRARHPRPRSDGPRAVDLVRAERDAR